MSYYELVKNIKLLKDSPMDYNLIKKIDDDKTKYHKYALTRLIVHIYDAVDERLNSVGYMCLKGIVNSKGDINEIELNFINLKKEKKYILELSKLKLFDIDTREKMKKRIINKFNEVYEYLKKQIQNIDIDEIYINRLEKIMQSDVEE